ncbi:LOW QUALITY PROTEIN: uncharacterized protein f2rl2 [Nelusetta ayraudi]|uniref:LOW QUALITY PROTEIN: uncharacterized protein f2rl2 n=1 Tax=Nelusetta ayraudi TaxID=303726 RepID=UPI003F71BB4C
MAAGMADLLTGLLISLLTAQTVQLNGNKSIAARNGSSALQPKTFRGRMYKLNLTELPAASSAPWLHVDSDNAVAAYTTGVLSTQVIPFSYVLAMLIGIPSNAYILAFLQLRAKYSPAAALYLNLALSDLLLLLSLAQRAFVRVSTVVSLIFAVSFSPSGVLHIAQYVRLFSDGGDGLYGYYRLTVCLCCFHSCLDPFLCALVSKTAASELKFISLRWNSQSAAAMLWTFFVFNVCTAECVCVQHRKSDSWQHHCWGGGRQ